MRCFRLLVQTADWLPERKLGMTQELLASMLGVRRAGITVAAGKLQAAGFISDRRGHISLLDRTGLEALACECYAAGKREQARLMAGEHFRQGRRQADPCDSKVSWCLGALARQSADEIQALIADGISSGTVR